MACFLVSGRAGLKEATHPERHVCIGSKADEMHVTESRPLHPTQRTNGEASHNVCVGSNSGENSTSALSPLFPQ
jgi:hypothetical protein